jgi:hypothetical protein
VNTRAPIGAADEGFLVLGWLTKLVVSLAIVGLIIFDGIALLVSAVNADDHAAKAASAAADEYRAKKNVQLAYNAAETEAAANSETVDTQTFRVGTDGRVTLTLHKSATTLWMQRVGFLKKYTKISSTATGSPAS